jgi:hypothetical protein
MTVDPAATAMIVALVVRDAVTVPRVVAIVAHAVSAKVAKAEITGRSPISRRRS